jgi:hypothetical protein
MLNRQPTMSNTSMIGMEVVVMPGKAIRIPANYGPPFHADFDGDEMNGFLPGSVHASTEARILTSLASGFISDATSTPIVSLHQDAVLGMHLLTLPHVRLTRQEVLRLTSSTGHPMVPRSSLPDAGRWAGADAAEVAFVHLGSDFSYSHAGATVAGGRLLSGPLRKAHVGSSSAGLVHCVGRNLGGQAALTMLDRFMDLANEFLLMRPPCMSAADIILGEGSPVVRPDPVLAKQFAQAREVDEASEIAEDVAVRAHRRRVTDPIAAGTHNTFTLLISEVKCKGSEPNLCQHYGAVGLQTVGGKLPSRTGGGKRTLPIFGKLAARSLEANGYVAESLADGLDVAGNYFHTWSSRSGLVEGRLNTPHSGYQQRSLIAPMKSCIVSHDGTVRSEGAIVQFCYGGDGAAPRRAVSITVSKEDLLAACATGDEDLNAAAAAIEEAGRAARGLPGDVKLSLPVPLVWLRTRFSAPAEAKSETPHDSEWPAVLAAALSLRPWEPSLLTRAALLIFLRPSERARLALTGERLSALLRAIVADWESSRVPGGMPVGVFVGTSIGPPATQSSLDAFHVAGMHRSGGGTSATSFDTLLNASRADGSGGMVIYLAAGSEAAAISLAEKLPQKTVASIMPRGVTPRLAAGDLAAEVLMAAHSAAGRAVCFASCVLVRLCSKKAKDPMAVAFKLEDALGCRVMHWPLKDASFVVIEAKSAKAAASLTRSLTGRTLSGVHNITSAFANRALDGRWTVETHGSNLTEVLAMPEVDASRSYSRCTQDTAATLGVEAAVACAYREIKRLIGLSGVDRRHLSLMADFMMRSGQPQSFSRHGMKATGSAPLARALHEMPLPVLGEAAIAHTENNMSAITTQIFAGNLVRCGTGFSEVLFDTEAGQRRRNNRFR